MKISCSLIILHTSSVSKESVWLQILCLKFLCCKVLHSSYASHWLCTTWKGACVVWLCGCHLFVLCNRSWICQQLSSKEVRRCFPGRGGFYLPVEVLEHAAFPIFGWFSGSDVSPSNLHGYNQGTRETIIVTNFLSWSCLMNHFYGHKELCTIR